MTIFIPKLFLSKVSHKLTYKFPVSFSMFPTDIVDSVMFSYRNYLKILNSIITSIMIKMMNFLFWFKESAYVLFDHKSVFSYISKTISKWMIGRLNKFIPITRNSTTFPSVICISSYKCFLKLYSAGNRTNFTPTLLYSKCFNKKMFATNYTFFPNKFHTLMIHPLLSLYNLYGE